MIEAICILILLALELLIVLSITAYMIQCSEQRTYHTIEILRAQVNQLIELMKENEDD